MKDSILAMQQTIGSPINTALAPDYTADKMVNFPSAWAQTLTEIPGTGVVGATYAVEIANGYDYMFQKGLLKDGDTVGHIYFEGEYGANGLAGTQAVAKERNLKVVEAQIKSSDQDMSSQITQFKAAGVKMVALTVAPTQLASAAAAMEAQGLDVPILGNNPVFAPGLLQGPAANKIKKDLYVASPVSGFDQHPDLLKQYQAAYPNAAPSLGVLVGIGMSQIMKQVLDSACANGDLTHQGVLDAFNGLTKVDTGGVVVPIRGYKTGKSPSLQSFVLQPADVPGGAKVVQDAFEGHFAAAIAG
jgi:ABC-type branched-subunit amino acid transport system substrate-binding protein